MKKKIEVVTVTAPSHWSTYLMYGDMTRWSETCPNDQEDLAAAQKLEAEYGPCIDCVDVGFLPYPDYGLAADCCEYTFHVHK